METLNTIASNPIVMQWSGAIVLTLLGYGFMRARRHPVKHALAFAGSIMGFFILLSLIKYLFF